MAFILFVQVEDVEGEILVGICILAGLIPLM